MSFSVTDPHPIEFPKRFLAAMLVETELLTVLMLKMTFCSVVFVI